MNIISRKTLSDRPVAIDLFSGCGRMSLGLEAAGFDIIASVKIDPIHSLVYSLLISPQILAEQGFGRLYLELIYPSSLISLPKDRGSEEQILRDRYFRVLASP